MFRLGRSRRRYHDGVAAGEHGVQLAGAEELVGDIGGPSRLMTALHAQHREAKRARADRHR